MRAVVGLLGIAIAAQIPMWTDQREFPDSRDRHRVEQWVQWKAHTRRLDAHFNSIPDRLAPEHSKYAEGLYMRGFLYYLLALGNAVGLCVYLVVRLRFRIWGGQAVKSDYFTTARRCAPGVLCVVGFCTFLSGGTVLLVASQHAHIAVQDGLQATKDTALLTSEVLIKLKQALVTVNMQHADEAPRFRIATGFLAGPIQDSLETLEDTEEMVHLSEDWERKRIVLTLVLFSLGSVLFLVALLGFLLKVESLMFCFSISVSMLGMLATILCGVYLGEVVGAGDYCEAVLKCVYDAAVPHEPQGLGLFFRDFNSTNRISLLEGRRELETAHSTALSVLNTRLMVLYSEPPVSSVADLEDRDAATARWAKTVTVTEAALQVRNTQDLEVYRRSAHVRQYCRHAETEACSTVMDDLYLGFTGLIIVTAGCTLAVCGGFSAPRILEKWRKEDHQKQLGKYNLYGM